MVTVQTSAKSRKIDTGRVDAGSDRIAESMISLCWLQEVEVEGTLLSQASVVGHYSFRPPSKAAHTS